MQEVDMSLFSPSHSIEELRMEMTEIIFQNNSVLTLLDSGGHARSGCVFILPFFQFDSFYHSGHCQVGIGQWSDTGHARSQYVFIPPCPDFSFN